MNGFLRFVVGQLIDDSQVVDLTEKTTANNRSFYLSLPASEVGKIIGKQGRTIHAIHSLMERAPTLDGLSVRFEVEEKSD